MFGVAKRVKLPRPKPLDCPVITDIHLRCPKPYCYAHLGRQPNTNQHVRAAEHKRRKDEAYAEFLENQRNSYVKDKLSTKFGNHAEKRRVQGVIKNRVDIRMQEYEDSIDRRREKLKALFAKEEREFYRETIDIVLRGDETRMQEMKERTQELEAAREQERQAVVKQKRVQQYSNRCGDLKTVLTKKALIECQNSQLQQIKDNQGRKEAEKELDRLWYDVTIKEINAKAEQAEYNLLKKKQQEKELVEAWDLQLKAKDELKADVQRTVEEERIELEKLKKQIEKEEYEALITKERKRDFVAKELEQQLELKEKFLAQRKKEEDDLIRSFRKLGQMEFDKEKSKIQNTTLVAKLEMAQYSENLAQIENVRKTEEARLNELLQKFMEEAQQKQNDARCKVELARQKLLRDVYAKRDEQIKIKRELAEEELKLKQAENDITRMSFETNERLDAEMSRQQKIAKRKYHHDLLKQIEYKQYLQQKEIEKLERQLAVGMKDEERYLKMIEEYTGEDGGVKKHPFRCVIERHGCNCPENP